GTPDGTAEVFPSRGIPVTPPALAPRVTAFQFLLCGIDSLDLGLYVAWGSDWKRRLHSLDKKKLQARKNGGLLIAMPSCRNCIFKPSGKGENYRFHLQFDAYNLFIGKAARPGTSPNVYLSISAKILWQNGIETALAWITEDLKAIGGGTIQLVQVSRLDLCADFHIPGGLSYEFINSHKVTRNDKGKLYFDKNELQTYYVGDGKSPIQARLYNKGIEVKQGGVKLWFLDL
ncbi:MAG: plasmid replication initiation factor, partial [Geobacteraceae bacterium]|nr:plasmid replication initiation factor [Geobacteraceae bacterium]